MMPVGWIVVGMIFLGGCATPGQRLPSTRIGKDGKTILETQPSTTLSLVERSCI
jgi:hypothetical protein